MRLGSPEAFYGTPEEVSQAIEILSHNWDILELRTIPAQEPEFPTLLTDNINQSRTVLTLTYEISSHDGIQPNKTGVC